MKILAAMMVSAFPPDSLSDKFRFGWVSFVSTARHEWGYAPVGMLFSTSIVTFAFRQTKFGVEVNSWASIALTTFAYVRLDSPVVLSMQPDKL